MLRRQRTGRHQLLRPGLFGLHGRWVRPLTGHGPADRGPSPESMAQE